MKKKAAATISMHEPFIHTIDEGTTLLLFRVWPPWWCRLKMKKLVGSCAFRSEMPQVIALDQK